MPTIRWFFFSRHFAVSCNHMKLRLTFLLILLLPRLLAQQFFFRNYSAENGLPFVQVACMHQDAKGYLWSGGYGGLSQFDGKIFQNYNKRDGLADQNVNAIATDDSGRVFVGTNNGLSVLKGRKFVNFQAEERGKNFQVNSLCKGFHYNMYVGTNVGLFLFKNDSLFPVKRLEKVQINQVTNGDTAKLYIATPEGLILFGHKTFERLSVANGLPDNNVTCAVAFQNKLVIGTLKGLCVYDRTSKKAVNYFVANGLIDDHITALENQNNEVVWIGTNNGLVQFDGKNFNYVNVGISNNANQIRCILTDRENNTWLGTHSGLYRYRDKSFTTFEPGSLAGQAFVYQVFRDRKRNLWATSQNDGVFQINQEGVRMFGSKEGLTASTLLSGIQDAYGRIYFGADQGLYLYNNGRFTKLLFNTQLTPPFNAIYEARDHTIWIGGSNGIASLRWNNSKTASVFYRINAPASFGVFAICEDKNGNIYAGTYKAGLYRLQADSMHNISEPLRLNEDNFIGLRIMNDKMICATLNGLLVLDLSSNQTRRITELDGLNSDLIYSIEISRDKKGLWAGTNQGIARIDLESLLNNKKIVVRTFGKQEGFSGVECNSNGIWEDEDGTMWFGTVSGLVKHSPREFKPNLLENATVIQQVRLMNEDTLLRNGAVLDSKLNTITFYYRGICLTNPDKVLYQKRLDGLPAEKEWSVPGPEDYIKYTNLPPGDYVFRVRSCNNEGVWNSHEATFSFSITAPLYVRPWFILTLILLSVSIIYVLFLLRLRYVQRRQRAEFERKVEMSKIELKALRAQMNPHFVFNSLNAIQHYIFNTRSDEAVKYLNKFAKLVRIILNNSEKPTVTVGEDLEALKLYLELEQMRFEGKFNYSIAIDDSVDPDYDIMPPLLMQPYVENAILHGLNPSPKKGHLTISLRSENNFLICSIVDDGIGRNKAAEIKRTMPVSKHRSLGMKITEDRLRILNEIHHSRLSVSITDLFENNEPVGTKVELFVPLAG